MGFLSGPVTYQAYHITEGSVDQFSPDELKVLDKFCIGKLEHASQEEATVGFLAGDHLFDGNFGLEKNVINDALHCAIRVDTDRIPGAIRKSWLQMELAALAADNPSGRPTKAQKQEAKEAVEARCEDEIRTGKFRRMQQFPVLWDARQNRLLFGGSSPTSSQQCCDVFYQAFEMEMEALSAGRRALRWATKAKLKKALDSVTPDSFQPSVPMTGIEWWNGEEGNFDFLGNELLLWLWYRWETKSDTIALPDGSDVQGMITRTLSLQCPRGESGKETISAEGPAKLPEALQAIRTGKLPRKAGLSLVRQGDQFDLVLQAETFTISGARIRMADDGAEGRGGAEDRIDSLRALDETVDLLFQAFCQIRVGKDWAGELEGMRRWLADGTTKKRTA